jgi:hypothetical protein
MSKRKIWVEDVQIDCLKYLGATFLTPASENGCRNSSKCISLRSPWSARLVWVAIKLRVLVLVDGWKELALSIKSATRVVQQEKKDKWYRTPMLKSK